MSTKFSSARLIVSVRRVFPWFLRDRHYAAIEQRQTPQKLEPIAKILADAGRDQTTPAD